MMSLKKVTSPRRLSLDEGTREYLEMGMDLTNKRKRYFSFHEKALIRHQDRLASLESSDHVNKDDLTTDDDGGDGDGDGDAGADGDGLSVTTAETTDVTARRSWSNRLSVNNYRETVKQCLLDSAKGLTNGFQLLQDIESGAVNADALNRCPKQMKRLVVLWACFVDRCDVVETFVRADAAAGARVDYTVPNRGYSAIHVSALSGCVDCIECLLKYSACDPDQRVDDMTALHFAAFTDSTDVMRALAEHGACRPDATVLHTAVKSQALECTRLLLSEYQADANALDSTGVAPVHICADRGYVDCLAVLLSRGGGGGGASEDRLSRVNVKDHRGYTALHWACSSAQLDCARLLIDRGADVHAKNGKQQTPMHLAARAQSAECMDMLMRAGADVNARDADDRMPLHAAIAHKTLNACLAVDALLGHRAEVNAQDRYGFTPLHLAALNEAPECVESLLARGAGVGIKTYGGISTLNMIVRKVPTCIAAVARQLDTAVTSNWAADGFKRGDPIMQLRFHYLLSHNDFGEIDLLKCFQKEGQYELLQHPLCQAFLFLKWRKVRKYYLMRLISLGFFILLYTLYVMTVLSHDCYNVAVSDEAAAASASAINSTVAASTSANNSTVAPAAAAANSSDPKTGNGTSATGCLTADIWLMNVNLHALYAISVIEGVFKMSEIASYVYVYQYFLSPSNLIEWLVLVSVPCISFHIYGPVYWQNPIGAFCVLCAWTNFMLKIGQLPWFDTYVAMYTKVQKEFAKLLMAYICLLIGFSVSLCVVFPTSPWFSNPVVGFVKVLVMMAGELDISILDNTSSQPFVSAFSAYVVYVALLIFVSIILMNLLVGIAVHDIQGLQKTAGLSKIRCQISLIHYIELFMLKSFWPKSIKRRALVFPSKNRTNLTIESLNPNQPLPREIIDAARILIKRKKRDSIDNKDVFKIQEILKEIKDLRLVVEENQKIIKHLLINGNTTA